MQKKCGHEAVCVECTRAEIAKLEKKISALKAKLPSQTVITINNGCGCLGGHYHHWHQPYIPRYSYQAGPAINLNSVYCQANAQNTLGGLSSGLSTSLLSQMNSVGSQSLLSNSSNQDSQSYGNSL